MPLDNPNYREVISAAGPPEAALISARPHSHEAESELAKQRRDEIAAAATEIISTEGIHKLSLARIEQRLSMSRGQLTYYFPTKESILLAVFDKMLERMVTEAIADGARQGHGVPGDGHAYKRLKYGLEKMLHDDKQDKQELLSIVHTFMAQIRHRDDFRTKIAAANSGWRSHLANDLEPTLNKNHTIPPAIVASMIMSLFQGLGGQLAVDPEAFDRTEMLKGCLQMIAPLFSHNPLPEGEQ